MQTHAHCSRRESQQLADLLAREPVDVVKRHDLALALRQQLDRFPHADHSVDVAHAALRLPDRTGESATVRTPAT